MEAAQEGHVDIVKFLIERGASIQAETNTGDTALTYACSNGHTVITDILLQCGAKLVRTHACGSATFHCVCTCTCTIMYMYMYMYMHV